MGKCLSLMLIAFLIMPFSAHAVLETGEGGDLGGGGGGGGGSKQVTIEKILAALQDAKNRKNPKLEELKQLLYVNPFITKEYSTEIKLGLWHFPENKTMNRTQEIAILGTVENPNPIEIRRALFLDLEVLDPGEKVFRQVNTEPQQINKNEYEIRDGINFSYRQFPEVTSFKYLKKVGDVVFRAKASDGLNPWISENLTLHVINNPPNLSNFSIESTNDPPRYKDRIDYISNLTDQDGDLVNVTLHVLDSDGKERGSANQQYKPGEKISFQAVEHGFFSKNDAGKNFTYYYTYGDGINTNKTPIQDGPRLRRSTAIWVDNPRVIPEDENQYWWQSYNFSIDMKNQDQGEAKVAVTLFTDTSEHPWHFVKSQDVVLTEEPKTVYFNVKPFFVDDAEKPYKFRFNYTEYDQHGNDYLVRAWPKSLNTKLVKYDLVSFFGFTNILVIIFVGLMLSIMIERRFYR